MVIGGYRLWPLLKKTGKEIVDDNVLGLSAQTAYYFFFSLFPLLLFLTPMLSFVGDKEAIMTRIMGELSATVPRDALNMLEGVIEEVVFTEGAPGLMSVGAVLALWAGSNVFNQMINALNRAYGSTDTRPFWKRRLLAVAAVLGAAVVVSTSAVVMLGGPQIIAWIGERVGMTETARLTWTIVQYPIAFSILVGFLWLVYYFLPGVKGQKKTHVLVGSAVAATLWILVTLGFRVYVSNFGNFSVTYGTIGAVIILLMWMYLTMLVLLVGGELNAELAKGTGAVKPRSGATYTGRLSTAEGEPLASNERVERV